MSVGKDFLDGTQKAMIMKENKEKLYFHNSIVSAYQTLFKKMKSQVIV